MAGSELQAAIVPRSVIVFRFDIALDLTPEQVMAPYKITIIFFIIVLFAVDIDCVYSVDSTQCLEMLNLKHIVCGFVVMHEVLRKYSC